MTITLTVAAVAKMKRCSARTVRRAIVAGRLLAQAVTPRLWLIDAKAAATWTPGVVGWKLGRTRKARRCATNGGPPDRFWI